MPHKSNPLLVNLDPDLELELTRSLQMIGYDPRSIRVKEGELVPQVSRYCNSLIIVDASLYPLESLKMCRLLTRQSGPYVILLSNAANKLDIVEAFKAGAEDYVVPPFYPQEIVERARRIMEPRSTRTSAPSIPRFKFYDELAGVMLDGMLVKLTRREYGVLKALADWPGRILTREQIISIAFPSEEIVSNRLIDNYIKTIRKRIRSANIKVELVIAVYGEGYMFAEL